MWTHLLRAATLIALVLSALPPSARAGTYTQFSCQHPDGTRAPTDNWWPDQRGGGLAWACASPALAMYAWVPYDTTGPASARISWIPSEGVTLRAFMLHRHVNVSPSSGTGNFTYRLSTITRSSISGVNEVVREGCDPRLSCTAIPDGDVTVSGLDLRRSPDQFGFPEVVVEVACENGACSDSGYGPSTAAYVSAARMVLEDNARPTTSEVGGSLASTRPVWGVASLTYKATDVGGGVYRHKLVVDGNTLVEEVANGNGGKCYDAMPGWGTPYEFDYTLPCAAKVDGRIALDLNRIAPGAHEISASIEDAAGNSRAIYSGAMNVLSDPARRLFDARGVVGLVNPMGDRPGYVANGLNASRDAVVDAYARRVRHGRQIGRPARATSTYPSSPTLIARVTAGGKPVANAVVSVIERESGSRTWRATRSLTTSRLGGVRVRLAPGPSREVRFAYVSDSESPTFVDSRSLTVNVRPRTTLSASPKRLRTGRRVRFGGRVTGGSIPPTGLTLSLQASGLDGRWLTFKTIRTTPAGRFRAAYRFTATTGSVRYRFRIRVLRQGGYPFAATYSRPVSVRVTG